MDPANLALLDVELRRDEGVSYVEYIDSLGNPSCGVGHNLNASPLPAGWTFPLTDDQVTALENHDLSVTFASLNLHLPWWTNLDPVRQRVIANMCFNMGIAKLLGFQQTLASTQVGQYVVASTEMLQSIWANQVGERAQRLSQAMKTGVMPVIDGVA
jgi:lysozyme